MLVLARAVDGPPRRVSILRSPRVVSVLALGGLSRGALLEKRGARWSDGHV